MPFAAFLSSYSNNETMFYTVITLNIRTPYPVTIIVLKMLTNGFLFPLMCQNQPCGITNSVIWVYTVCSGIAVPIFRVIAVLIKTHIAPSLHSVITSHINYIVLLLLVVVSCSCVS